MKKLIFIFLIALASCKKETSNNSNNIFTETKDNVQLNEPVLLSFGDNSSNETVTWKCEPVNGASVDIVRDYATFTFANAGSYTVTATNSSTKKQATYIINVINTLYDEFNGNFGLGASKPIKVSINENVVFTVHNPVTTVQSTDWSVHSIPSTFVGFNNNFTQMTVSFQSAGAKFVSITNGGKTETKSVWVEDQTSQNGVNIPFLLGDKISVTPSLTTDSNGKKTLNFSAAANYKYRCSSDNILTGLFTQNGNYVVSFNGVNTTSNPCLSIVAPTGTQSLANMVAGKSYPFKIIYQNKMFTGSVDVSQNNVFTINFTDNNLISINPKTLQ